MLVEFVAGRTLFRDILTRRGETLRISYTRLFDGGGTKFRLTIYFQDEAGLDEVKRAVALMKQRPEVRKVRTSSVTVPLAEAKAFRVTLDFGAPIQPSHMADFFTFLDQLPMKARERLTA